uniref:DZF domain-containing protein n=1 Tax=Propithecus coquereli TaxID=379532 RepID=A0A2K6GQH8_PROCO
MHLMPIFVNDDRHVMAKHSSVYPMQEELEAVQNMVSHTERVLKAVSNCTDEQEKGSGEHAKSDSMDVPPEDESKEGPGLSSSCVRNPSAQPTDPWGLVRPCGECWSSWHWAS